MNYGIQPSITRLLTDYFLYSCLAVFCTLWSSEGYVQTIERVESARKMALEILDLNEPVSLGEIANGPLEIFAPPNSLHTKGMIHSAMYRSFLDGKPTLIKVIFPDSEGYVGMDRFQEQVFTAVLAAKIGGPRIYRAGRILDANNREGLYIQMEEMFPDEADTFTFKGWGSKSELRRRLSFRWPSAHQLDAVGQMLNAALKSGIEIGVDVDFIFSNRTDDVRWLDVSDWSLKRKANFDLRGPTTQVFDFASNSEMADLELLNYGNGRRFILS